jgi:hypothetical protein
MSRKKADGLDALIRTEPVPIEEITLLDWFASFAMLRPDVDNAQSAYEIAEAMLKRRATFFK